MPKSKTFKKRIEELELATKNLQEQIGIFQAELYALRNRMAGVESKYDPWRPIGPKPDERLFPDDYLPRVPQRIVRAKGVRPTWTITCDTDVSGQD